MPASALKWARQRAPEIVLATLAAVVFLGCLGSQDLWGKREQRSAAETIDTLRAGHWLVAEIQGRPRLEKPPLPRWTIAGLMLLTGRQDESIVRLPAACSALGMVALVYALGRRIGGRNVGLSAGLALTSSAFFIAELRQAGNDGPLAFFTTLAIYAAWRRLHGGPAGDVPGQPGDRPGARRWALLMYAALGLGFLCKGPIVAVIALLAVAPYLAIAGRLRPGLGLLLDGWGALLFVLLALSWPVPVMIGDPNAVKVWQLEIGQKAGTAGITHHQKREVLALQWFWMTAPWSAIATWALLRPILARGRGMAASSWLPVMWAGANLAMFCFWKVAKPNYFLPCLPGVALMVGEEWVRLCGLARGAGVAALRARRFLGVNAAAVLVASLAAPAVAWRIEPALAGWTLLVCSAFLAGVLGGVAAWRRGAVAGVLAPPVAALAAGVLVAYGGMARGENAARSHRALAATLERVLPADVRTVMFFHELDEGLWFYLRDRELRPVPGSTPVYNDGFDLLQEARRRRGNLPSFEAWAAERLAAQRDKLLEWMSRPDRDSAYVLVRGKLYDQIAADLTARSELVYREQGVKRNDVVLLRVRDAVAAHDSTRR